MSGSGEWSSESSSLRLLSGLRQEVLVGKDDSFSTSLMKSLYAGTDICEQEPVVGTSQFSGTPLRHPQYHSL